MEIQKVYVKTRAEFGKQCTFNMSVPHLDVNIMPNPADMEEYVRRTHCHVGVQHSEKMALHKAQISCAPTKNSGMSHFEGGWPREINPRDEEATARFRRRVEKGENWAPKLRNLFEVMQYNILQNGTVNIYDHYFDDMIPTELVQHVGLRTANMYRDPETPKRPVTSISWSPDFGSRIVVSYCFLEFGRRPDYSNTVYIWEVENSNEPYMGLEPFYPCATSEFNPRDPSVLVGGLINGQVCNWDTRASKHPVQSSHLQHSHRECVNAVKWLPSKSNTEFFSTSPDGRAMWWDTRHLREPTETLVFDLEQPNDPHMDRAIGVSCLNFGPMVGTKFMFGLDNGIILTGSRKAKTNAEKLSMRLEAHYGRVNSVDRNFLNQSVFLSVGDWRAQVWAEDTREGSLVSTPFLRDYPTGGCWNKARHSAFYVTTASGQLLVWDILQTLRQPVFTLQLCHQELTCLAPCEEGVFLTIGNIVGEVFLVEPSEFFQSFDKAERALFSEYTERRSKVAKSVDGRLKEIKLVQKIIEEDQRGVAVKVRETAKEKAKGKTVAKPKRKEKEVRISRGKDKKRFEAPEIIEAERKYFEAVQKELEVYASETDPTVTPVPPHLAATKKLDKIGKPRKRVEKDGEDSPKKSQTKLQARVSIKVRIEEQEEKRQSEPRSIKELMALPSGQSLKQHLIAPAPSIELDVDAQTEAMQQMLNIAFKLPVPCEGEVCKPKVCCWRPGWKGRRKGKSRADRKTTTESPGVPTETPWTSRKLQRQQSRLLRQAQEPPSVMTEEVARAITEIRIANWTTGRTSQKQAMEKCLETKKKPVRRRKVVLRPKRDPPQLAEKSVQDSRKRETTLLGKERKRRVIVDPCSPPEGKTTQEQITTLLNIPPLELSEKKVKGRRYLEEYEQARKIVYPRISEFHLIN